MITIELRKGDLKTQAYVQTFVSGRMFRRTIEMQAELKDGVNVTVLDKMVNYVVELFGKQFTVDEFYDGVAATEMIPTIVRCINTVVGKAGEAIGSNSGGADPN